MTARNASHTPTPRRKPTPRNASQSRRKSNTFADFTQRVHRKSSNAKSAASAQAAAPSVGASTASTASAAVGERARAGQARMGHSFMPKAISQGSAVASALGAFMHKRTSSQASASKNSPQTSTFRASVKRDAPSASSSRERVSRGARPVQVRTRRVLSFFLPDGHVSFAYLLRMGMLLLVCALIASIGFFVASKLPICTITNLSVLSSDHVRAEDIRQLAAIEDGTTLLNLDEDKISARLKKIPWVESVNYKRTFPSSLELSINEKKVDMIVQIGGSSVCWYLSQDGMWIEPVSFPRSDDGPSIKEQVIARSKKLGAVALCDLPESVNPQAGTVATDETIAMVQAFRKAFSASFSARIASYSAPSTESISATTSSGVDISLGSASQINLKEQVITEILNKYEGQITYINARMPSKPSYRMISNSSTKKGAGV